MAAILHLTFDFIFAEIHPEQRQPPQLVGLGLLLWRGQLALIAVENLPDSLPLRPRLELDGKMLKVLTSVLQRVRLLPLLIENSVLRVGCGYLVEETSDGIIIVDH